MFQRKLHFVNEWNNNELDVNCLKKVLGDGFYLPSFLEEMCAPGECKELYKNHLIPVSNDNDLSKVKAIRKNYGQDHHCCLMLCDCKHEKFCELSQEIGGPNNDEIILWEESLRDNPIRCVCNIRVPTIQGNSVSYYTSTLLGNTIGMTWKHVLKQGSVNRDFWYQQFWFTYLVSTLLSTYSQNGMVGRGGAFWDNLFDEEIPKELVQILREFNKKWMSGAWHRLLKDFATASAGAHALSMSIAGVVSTVRKNTGDFDTSRETWKVLVGNLQNLLDECDNFIVASNRLIQLVGSRARSIKKHTPRDKEWLGMNFGHYFCNMNKFMEGTVPRWAESFFYLLVMKRVQNDCGLSNARYKTVRGKFLTSLRLAVPNAGSLDTLLKRVDRLNELNIEPDDKSKLKDAINYVWTKMME